MKQFLQKLLSTLVGHVEWRPPGWLAWSMGRLNLAWAYIAADARRAALFVLALMAIAAGIVWYRHRPVPHYVEYTVTAPGITEYGDKGISSIKPLTVDFQESAAPLANVEKPVTTGVEISPKMAGVWFWVNDKQLLFTPKNDWPVDGAFTVHFARKGFLARDRRLEEYGFDFRSQPFSAKITDSQFYQDPRDATLKKLVATVQFSHPADTGRFEERVSLAFAKDAEYACQYVDCVLCGGDPGGILGYRYLCGVVEHRDAVRVYRGFGGCDRAAEETAGTAAEF